MTAHRCVAAGLALFAGCTPPGLSAVRDADQSNRHRASLRQGAIEISADVGGERPVAALPRNLTPVKVRITNTTDRGIHLSLDEVGLAGLDGTAAAIRVEGIHLWRPVPTMGALPGAPPALPHLVPIRTLRDLKIGSPEYFTALRGKHPQKRALEKSALRDGYVEPGETVEGYVFFDHVPDDDAGRVRLRLRIRSGAHSGTLTDAEIPFAVD